MVKKVLGIDEAGRGPLIGSMFMVGTMFKESDLPFLRSLGVKDSKMLLHPKRVELAKDIRKIALGVKVIEVKPDEIDRAVQGDDGLNLNWLEALKQAEIINVLMPDKAVIDCPSTNIKSYTAFLKKHIKKDLLVKLELVVEHRADQNFVESSSASVIAKVERESHMASIRKKLGIDCGSGYPSDPATKEFVKKYGKKYPEIFRRSWSTYQKLFGDEQQAGLDKF